MWPWSPLGMGPPPGREAPALTRLLPTKLPSLCPPSCYSRFTVFLRPPVSKLSEEAGAFPVSPGKGKPLCFHRPGHGLHPLVGELRYYMP